MTGGPRSYGVQPSARRPLINFMLSGLTAAGCTVLHVSAVDRAPFMISFESAAGERAGIVAYAFRATRTPTNNRPPDEQSFQIKYGSKRDYAENSHEFWQDPYALWTTLLLGIDPEQNLFVAADPIQHSPTKFFIRVEFKDEQVEQSKRNGWHAWRRERRTTLPGGENWETIIGGTAQHFLDLVRFERVAKKMPPADRLRLARGWI